MERGCQAGLIPQVVSSTCALHCLQQTRPCGRHRKHRLPGVQGPVQEAQAAPCAGDGSGSTGCPVCRGRLRKHRLPRVQGPAQEAQAAPCAGDGAGSTGYSVCRGRSRKHRLPRVQGMVQEAQAAPCAGSGPARCRQEGLQRLTLTPCPPDEGPKPPAVSVVMNREVGPHACLWHLEAPVVAHVGLGRLGVCLGHPFHRCRAW